MSIVLKKSETVNLTKTTNSLERVRVVLGWTTPVNVFPRYDLDVSAFLLGSNGKLIDTSGFVFYNNERSPDGSVWKTPDERAGGTEELFIDIDKLPQAIAQISIVVTIDKADVRKQTFANVKGSYLEIYNDITSDKIAYFALDCVDEKSTAIQVGSFYLSDEGFTFQGLGIGFALKLDDFFEGYTY